MKVSVKNNTQALRIIYDAHLVAISIPPGQERSIEVTDGGLAALERSKGLTVEKSGARAQRAKAAPAEPGLPEAVEEADVQPDEDVEKEEEPTPRPRRGRPATRRSRR